MLNEPRLTRVGGSGAATPQSGSFTFCFTVHVHRVAPTTNKRQGTDALARRARDIRKKQPCWNGDPVTKRRSPGELSRGDVFRHRVPSLWFTASVQKLDGVCPEPGR